MKEDNYNIRIEKKPESKLKVIDIDKGRVNHFTRKFLTIKDDCTDVIIIAVKKTVNKSSVKCFSSLVEDQAIYILDRVRTAYLSD
jgi:hypothetical protein